MESRYRYFTLSTRQIRMLRYVDQKNVKLEHLRQANQLTLWSLLKRGLVRRMGEGLVVTQDGQERLKAFSGAELIARQTDGDLSRRVGHLLTVVRKMRAAA